MEGDEICFKSLNKDLTGGIQAKRKFQRKGEVRTPEICLTVSSRGSF